MQPNILSIYPTIPKDARSIRKQKSPIVTVHCHSGTRCSSRQRRLLCLRGCTAVHNAQAEGSWGEKEAFLPPFIPSQSSDPSGISSQARLPRYWPTRARARFAGAKVWAAFVHLLEAAGECWCMGEFSYGVLALCSVLIVVNRCSMRREERRRSRKRVLPLLT